MTNVIDQELNSQIVRENTAEVRGPIATIASSYTLDSDRLLGFLIKLDFAESHIVTCDPWKRKCGGIPRGSFVIFKIDPRAVNVNDIEFCNRLIIARITDAVPTPVEGNVQQTLFQIHKLQAQLDPLTNKELQWGALKASIIGTFYDHPQGKIDFGNDVDTFFSAFTYVAYSPTNEHLNTLINAFVEPSRAITIGSLRYTETLSPRASIDVPIKIDPRDIVGEQNAAQRLANFGKTRFGKSNSTKIISRSIFQSELNVAQVFFDPSGEYTYINDQDRTSLFALFHDRSVRYALVPKNLRQDERDLGLSTPRHLAINFYTNPDVGHSLIVSLWDTENDNQPLYLRPLMDWSPSSDTPDRNGDRSLYNHYWRTMAMWYTILIRAEFPHPENLRVPINFPAAVKQDLVSNVQGVRTNANGEFSTAGQPATVLRAIYERVYVLWQNDRQQNAANQRARPGRGGAQNPQPAQPVALNFPPSSTGEPYFNDIETTMLRIIADPSISGHRYIQPFNKYHHISGSSIFNEISNHIENGISVFIDMSQANEVVRNNLVDRICRSIYRLQNNRFVSEQGVGEEFVMLYFEEAHRLFRSDDKDMNSIYNLIAKEGAKLNIAMVYSTQSMTTMSPDLIKNTDNFLIAHLDDDREAREVARKYAFKDVAEDVQRIQSKGYVRMITRSHRFALPVQIERFRAE